MARHNERFEFEERSIRYGKIYHTVRKQRYEHTELKQYDPADTQTVLQMSSNKDNSKNKKGRLQINELLLIIAIILVAAIITTFSPELGEYLRPLFEELFTHLNL